MKIKTFETSGTATILETSMFKMQAIIAKLGKLHIKMHVEAEAEDRYCRKKNEERHLETVMQYKKPKKIQDQFVF